MTMISSNLDFTCYSVARRMEWLDTNILIIGAAQTGKSTLASAIAEAIYYYQNKPFTTKFIDDNIAFNSRQGINMFKKFTKDVIIVDEGYLAADRRESMSFLQIKYLAILNFMASRHNTIITVMQQYDDLDSRIIKKTDILILITEIGHGKIYVGSKRYPIIKQQILNTERFEKKPGLLSEEIGEYEIKKDRNYVFDVIWRERKDAWWQHYIVVKEYWQEKTLEQINKRLERFENAERRTDMKEIAQRRIEIKSDYTREELQREGLI